MTQTILSISGKPGLYKLISHAKMSLIVEQIDKNHKRIPIFATDRVTSLSDISIYTEDEDIHLWKVLKSIGEKEESKILTFNYKKASDKELREYFREILPNFDENRVHDNDIKKVLQWYDILIENGIIDFQETLDTTQE